MRYTREQAITGGVILVILLLGALYTWSTISKQRALEAADNPATHALTTEADQAPYTDLEGNILTLTEYVGEVLVVNSWASWSPDSARELPLIATITSEYEDRDVRVLAINRAEPRTTAERFLRTFSITDKVQLVLDPDDRYYRSIAGYSMPETIFYDRKGNIVHHHHGVMTEADIRNYLDAAIAATEKDN